jgi:hypothetical protein
MKFPSELLKSVAIYHLPTTAGAKQPYPGSASTTVTGAFLPLDRHAHALEGGSYMAPHEVYFEQTVDVREGDKLVIEGSTYFVKQRFVGTMGGLPHIRCSISTQR